MKAIELRKGSKIEHKDDVWVVTDTTHRTPGKGQAVVQVRLSSLTVDRSMNERFRSTEEVNQAEFETRKMNYLYREGDLLTFMDNETYDQLEIDAAKLGDQVYFLKENMDVIVQFINGTPISLDLPAKVVQEIVETEPGVKGDTVNNVTKDAKTETGLKIQVPLFVEEGDKIRINTETGLYVERAKE